MDRPTAIPLRIGEWCVNPTYGQISRGEEIVRVEARTMKLLLCLAQHAGETVSIDDLLNEVWAGVVVTPDSVYQAIASLRRLLGDDAKQPAYIVTVPRLGYRMVADVGPWAGEVAAATGAGELAHATADASPPKRFRRALLPAAVAAVALCVALITALLLRGNPTKSVAVLPFLDLTTQEMNEEYFADGMTEELIDRLSKVPGLRVPSATASFYYKGKQLKVADIAKSLGVTYILDGSVRKSDATMRVAARLIRAQDGYVIWTETYDRPLDNKLSAQEAIAGEVAQALQASIH